MRATTHSGIAEIKLGELGTEFDLRLSCPGWLTTVRANLQGHCNMACASRVTHIVQSLMRARVYNITHSCEVLKWPKCE